MHDYTSCYLYSADPPDYEQQACSKYVEAYYWNKLIENSASCWFMLYRYITMHGQQNIKYICILFNRVFSRRVDIFILNSYKCVQILRELLYSYVLKGTSINTV
jgi:hypothetical protein